MQTIKKIYLHWSATPYSWQGLESNGLPAYHSVFNDLGAMTRHVNYQNPLPAHTFHRNSNSIALACACMGGRGMSEFPPTHAQVDAMCKEAARVAYGLGWQADPHSLSLLILTHAEAAANRDYPLSLASRAPGKDDDSTAETIGLPHDNYGPSHWRGAPVYPQWPGGTVDRWDWWYCHPEDEATGAGGGGYVLRDQIISHMKAMKAAEKK